MNKELSLALSIICIFILVMGFVGNVDYVEQRNAQDLYCEMVALNKSDKDAGVPELERKGWSDYRGTFDEACAGRE